MSTCLAVFQQGKRRMKVVIFSNAVVYVMPDEPSEGREQHQKDGDPGPAQPDIRARCVIFRTAFAYIFRKLDPAYVVIFKLAAFLVGGHEAIDPGIFVKADNARIAAHDALVENTAGEGIKMLFFESKQVAAADLGDICNRLERDAAGFPLSPQIFAELTHAPVPAQIRFGVNKYSNKMLYIDTARMHNL